MPLTRLQLTQFRNFLTAELDPHPIGFNLIYGQNGSGKTSLIESVHFLSLGRSFRSSVTDRMVNNQSEKFSLFAQILTDYGQEIPLGIERNKDKSAKIRLAGQDQQSIAELTRLIPIRLIHSQSYHLIDGGPLFRRKYIDWGLFYQKIDFLALWQRFERVLKQRNAALKTKSSRNEVDIWTAEFLETALLLDQLRRNYVKEFTPVLLQTITEVLEKEISGLQIEYDSGWDSSYSLETILVDAYYKDARFGYTQYGPQKADLKLLIQGVPVKDFLSRGQQKLFVCAMILAQGKWLFESANKHPIFLIDDLPSELDRSSLGKVMRLLQQQQTQVFLTAIDLERIEEFLPTSTKMFHVEQGTLYENSGKL